ncbi:hypothetical protein [Mannheimia haemolytica]|uniref:hypothetical protein n=1 Tax=Mannheimia haemolytica TaxID=75985 RepID=UPI002EBC06FE|nr:hypothetical protein [Mannheimia haemolytica]
MSVNSNKLSANLQLIMLVFQMMAFNVLTMIIQALAVLIQWLSALQQVLMVSWQPH